MMVRLLKGRDGVAYVYTVEGYRDENGKVKQRILVKHGRLDVLTADDPDALAKLKAEAKRATVEKKALRGMIGYDTGLPADGGQPRNLGWLAVDATLARLGVVDAVTQAGATRTGREAWRVDVGAVLRALVAARVMWPCSKRATAAKSGRLFAAHPLDLDQTYRALDHLGELSDVIQQAASAGLGRDASAVTTVDYDVTNFFFHIDTPDDVDTTTTTGRGQASRQRGHSKENRVEPIIQLGLFLDNQGIPVSYRTFHGNTPDTSTLATALDEFTTLFHPGRIVVVADKAMNTTPNIAHLSDRGDGWIVSASARHATRRLQAWVLDPTGWEDHDGWTTKSMTTDRPIPYILADGTRITVTVPEKLVAHWSPDAAARDRATRAEMLTRARKLADNPALFTASTRTGVKKYVTENRIDPATGEILDPTTIHLDVDQARADREALFDGYQMIRTSETSLADTVIVDRYHQLWRIEQSFRVSKTDLATRPVFVWTPAHIEAHFLTCFLALLITRVWQHWTGLPSGQLLDGFRHLDAIDCGQGVYRICRPDVWDTIDQATGVPLNQSWATITQLNAWRRALTKTLKTANLTTNQNQ